MMHLCHACGRSGVFLFYLIPLKNNFHKFLKIPLPYFYILWYTIISKKYVIYIFLILMK